MAQKTVKVDEGVHQRLEELKREYGAETFNEVLRHELDIISEPEIDELAAFLQDDVKETARSVVEIIRGIGQFDEQVKEEQNKEVLEFVSKDSGKVIANIRFDEKSFQVQYRGQNGEMGDCGRGWYSSTSEKPKFGRHSDIYDHTEPSDVIEQVEAKVTGAYERWGK
jgi:predicted CopG family antitoxin